MMPVAQISVILDLESMSAEVAHVSVDSELAHGEPVEIRLAYETRFTDGSVSAGIWDFNRNIGSKEAFRGVRLTSVTVQNDGAVVLTAGTYDATSDVGVRVQRRVVFGSEPEPYRAEVGLKTAFVPIVVAEATAGHLSMMTVPVEHLDDPYESRAPIYSRMADGSLRRGLWAQAHPGKATNTLRYSVPQAVLVGSEVTNVVSTPARFSRSHGIFDPTQPIELQQYRWVEMSTITRVQNDDP